MKKAIAVVLVSVVLTFGAGKGLAQGTGPEYLSQDMEDLFFDSLKLYEGGEYTKGFAAAKRFMDLYADTSIAYDFFFIFFNLYVDSVLSRDNPDYRENRIPIRLREFEKLKQSVLEKKSKEDFECLIAAHLSHRVPATFDPYFLKNLVREFPSTKYAAFADYVLMSDFKNSVEEAQEFMRKYPRSMLIPRVYFLQAKKLHNSGDLRAAREKYKQILRDYPGDYYTAAKAIVEMSRAGEAVEEGMLETANSIRKIYDADARKPGVRAQDVRRLKEKLK